MTSAGGQPITWRAAEAEAQRLVEVSAGTGISLHLIGSLAVRAVCPRSRWLMDSLGRRPARDIDFVTYARHERAANRLFEASGYIPDPSLKHSREFGIKRLIFHHPESRLKVDVFLDQLVMAHTIDFTGRLDREAPTVRLADLLLSKLQIHEITENDMIDTAVILADHDVSQGGIDVAYLAKLLGSDWGFYHSASLNLAKLEAALQRWNATPAAVSAQVARRAATLREAIEVAPKSLRWRARARVGERLRWYEEVSEVEG